MCISKIKRKPEMFLFANNFINLTDHQTEDISGGVWRHHASVISDSGGIDMSPLQRG